MRYIRSFRGLAQSFLIGAEQNSVERTGSDGLVVCSDSLSRFMGQLDDRIPSPLDRSQFASVRSTTTTTGGDSSFLSWMKLCLKKTILFEAGKQGERGR